MKLDCVLTAVNEHELYIDLIPLFIKFWNKLYPEVDVKIILIANSIPEEYLCYKDNIILFEPIETVSTAFTSQFIRLLYPSLLDYKNGLLITDIDDWPMNRHFFTKNIEEFPDDKWINMRNWTGPNQISMCWQVTTPKIWKEVFQVHSLEDVKEILLNVSNKVSYVDGPGKRGWYTDQIYLHEKVMDWNKKTKNYVFLHDNNTKFRRLNRDHFRINNPVTCNNITNGEYSDYHCLRPNSKHFETNNKIFDLL